MSVMFEGSQVLFDGGQVAMHEDCCCEEDPYNICDDNCPTCFVEDKTPEYYLVNLTGIEDCYGYEGMCSVLNGEWVFFHNVPCYWIWSSGEGDYATFTLNSYQNLTSLGSAMCFHCLKPQCTVTGSCDSNYECGVSATFGGGGSASWHPLGSCWEEP